MTPPDLDKLTASPHWEWRPGMAGVGFEPGRSIYVRVYADFAAVDEQEDTIVSTARGLRPDLDDDATCGCLLTLVRKAWGPECEVEIEVFKTGAASVVVRTGNRTEMFVEPSLGLALAAALLAAPGKAGEP